MQCTRLNLPGGLTAIVCTSRQRRKRCSCGAVSTLQCDWKMGDGETCDRHLCETCGEEVAPEKHLCPQHQKSWREHRLFRP